MGEWSPLELCTACEGRGEVPLFADPSAGSRLLAAAEFALEHLRRHPVTSDVLSEHGSWAAAELMLDEALEAAYEGAPDDA